MSLILEFLFGWIVELLPLSMSATARKRSWKRGERVALRARVSQDLRVGHIELRGYDGLWLVRNRGLNAESREEVNVSDFARVEFPQSAFARPDSAVEITRDEGGLTIACPTDWDLLREVATVWLSRISG